MDASRSVRTRATFVPDNTEPVFNDTTTVKETTSEAPRNQACKLARSSRLRRPTLEKQFGVSRQFSAMSRQPAMSPEDDPMGLGYLDRVQANTLHRAIEKPQPALFTEVPTAQMTKQNQSEGYREFDVNLGALGLKLQEDSITSTSSLNPAAELIPGIANMLVLSRKKDERIIIGDNISIMVVEIRGDKVRLGIEAPRDVPVHREEVYNAIQRRDQNPDNNPNQ